MPWRRERVLTNLDALRSNMSSLEVDAGLAFSSIPQLCYPIQKTQLFARIWHCFRQALTLKFFSNPIHYNVRHRASEKTVYETNTERGVEIQ